MKTKSYLTISLFFCGVFMFLLFPQCGKDDEVSDDIVIDVEGNTYQTIIIGANKWMKENLRTTKFRDGSVIPLVEGTEAWISTTTSAFCWPENNSNNKNLLGALYNGFAFTDARGLCPSGWHVATDQDWFDLEMTLGMDQASLNTEGDRGEQENVGGKLKSLQHWDSPNEGASNSSGFSALGTGYRRPPGEFDWFRQWTGFYTSTTSGSGKLWMRYLGYNMKAIAREKRPYTYAYSCRCVED